MTIQIVISLPEYFLGEEDCNVTALIVQGIVLQDKKRDEAQSWKR